LTASGPPEAKGDAAVKADTESSLVKACLDWLQLHGILAWRSNNVGVYDPARRRFRAFRGRKGVSDILGLVEWTTYFSADVRSVYGILLAVEVKMPEGRLTKDQEAFLDEVNRRGGIALCVHSVGELAEKMKPLGVS